MFDRIYLWSHLVLDFCLLKVFKSQFQFQYLWLVCSYFLFSSWFSFFSSKKGDYTFLRIFPFLLSCPFYWCIVACSSLLWSFVFLQCWLVKHSRDQWNTIQSPKKPPNNPTYVYDQLIYLYKIPRKVKPTETEILSVIFWVWGWRWELTATGHGEDSLEWKYPKTGCGPGINLPKIIELLSYSLRIVM